MLGRAGFKGSVCALQRRPALQWGPAPPEPPVQDPHSVRECQRSRAWGLCRPRPAWPEPRFLERMTQVRPSTASRSPSWGRRAGCCPAGRALSPGPEASHRRPRARCLRRGQLHLLCRPGQSQPFTAVGPACGQGGGFTLSPPQTGQAEKKAGGDPGWGPPASQGSPGAGLGSMASLPRASVACPCRLVPSQLEGHLADV